MQTDVNEVTEGDSGEEDHVLGLVQDLETVYVEVEVDQGNGKYMQFIFRYLLFPNNLGNIKLHAQ